MPRGKLTNSSSEALLSDVIAGDNVFSIPYFQRGYKWKSSRLEQLNADILSLVDEALDFHFLGAVIIHGRNTDPSEPNIYDVIDGQQRLTTVYLYMCAIVKELATRGELKEAGGLFLKYLVINRETDLMSNFKLHPCKDDRNQLNYVLSDVLAVEGFKRAVKTFEPSFLPASGSDRGTMRKNYKAACRFVTSEFEQGGIERVRAVYKRLLESISVVQIDVLDPTNGPKIFNSLNSRQEPMTIGDLVRNEIFQRVAHENAAKLEQIDSNHWRPFYEGFQENGKNYFDSYFFPYGLICEPNLRKSEVFGFLSKKWSRVDEPKKIVKELATFQDAFIDFMCGTNRSKLPTKSAKAFNRLHSMGAPGSVLPFAMQFVKAASDNKITEKTFVEVIDVLESFLVRRAICGHEPTGLHAVFKKLWKDTKGKPTADNVRKAIGAHTTVVWPSNEEVKNSIMGRKVYKARISPYLIREIDRAEGGDVPIEAPWIEHVLPENPVPGWYKVFSRQEHEAQKDLLANLIPLSQQMNQSLQNSLYSKKRPIIRKDSQYKSARSFAATYKQWTPSNLEARSRKLASWAVKRWRH